MAHSSQPAPARTANRPETSAWLLLSAFFGVFCLLIALAVSWGWSTYQNAMTPLSTALLRSHVGAGVVVQSKGRLEPSSIDRLPAESDPCPNEADLCRPLVEGDTIRTQIEAGYGPVASLVLPDRSQIDVWAHPRGVDVTLERYRVSRWSNQLQDVRLRQTAGYVRYDVMGGQSYREVRYAVDLGGGTEILLAPGGSYSIDIPDSDPNRLPRTTDAGTPLFAEIAVRAGRATVVRNGLTTIVESGLLVRLGDTGPVEAPVVAQWNLVQDGDFARADAQNNYDEGSRSWQRAWNWPPGMSELEKNGRFVVLRACRPETPNLCTPADQTFVGQFRREGGQTRPFTTSIYQPLNADISEFTSLRLTAWVRVLTQTVELAGIAGSECPIMIQIEYKPTSPTDRQESRYFCIYTADQAASETQEAGQIRYRPVPPFQWYRLDVDLRDDTLLREARFLQEIRIEARGHDYISEIADVALTGTQ